MRQPLLDPALSFAAKTVDELEAMREAAASRLRAMRDEFGLDDRMPEVALMAEMVEALKGFEVRAVKQLEKKMRAHPLGSWQRTQHGVGEKQLARLLGAIGDPYIRPAGTYAGVELPQGPRTVSALWALAGYRPGQKHRKGVQSNWSPEAKMRAYLIAESCIKVGLCASCRALRDGHANADAPPVPAFPECACSPYRRVYDRRKAHTAARDWTDAHRHADALRVLAKEILKQLWRAARDWYA